VAQSGMKLSENLESEVNFVSEALCSLKGLILGLLQIESKTKANELKIGRLSVHADQTAVARSHETKFALSSKG
jgi:hypothetical protein